MHTHKREKGKNSSESMQKIYCYFLFVAFFLLLMQKNVFPTGIRTNFDQQKNPCSTTL